MNAFELAMILPLIALAFTAAVIDLRSRRIPNWLTLLLAVAGLINALVWRFPVDIAGSTLGLLAGFGLLLLPFALGAIGGGDVKLLAAIGAWVGPGPVLQVFVIAAVVALAIAVTQAAAHGKLAALFRNSAVLAANVAMIAQTGRDDLEETGKSLTVVKKPLPYAVPILAGLLLTICV